MLNADTLSKMAVAAATRAEAVSEQSSTLAELALIECAIYTVGAEIVGRMDNMHFSAASWRQGDGSLFTDGKVSFSRRSDDSDSTEQDSKLDTEATPAAGSPEGE